MSENQTAVSVYSQDGMDDFPVLKAFQQYIDSEQAKARKRLVMLGVFFCILIGAVIAVFVAMLASVTARNQQLNDRLVEFAMKERASAPAKVVQQPAQDNSMILALTAKLDEMQKKLDESRAKAEKEAAVAAERARIAAQQQVLQQQKTPSAEEVEIKRLKALLEIEQKKAAEEKERRRQEELEAYRRRQYPELYRPQTPAPAKTPRRTAKGTTVKHIKDADDEINAIVAELGDDTDDGGAISYFDDDEQAAPEKAKPRTTVKQARKPSAKNPESKAKAATEKPAPYNIPVEVKNIGNRRWHVPMD